MSYQYVNVVIIRKVAVIEFNYARKLNALSKVFIDDLMLALSDLNRRIFAVLSCVRPAARRSSPPVMTFMNFPPDVAIRSLMTIRCARSPA